jgi:hypothetical protein
MKLSISTWMLTIIVFCACNITGEKNTIKSFIPGTYVLDTENEYSKVLDTLSISKAGEQGNSYVIIRSTSFKRRGNKKAAAWEHKNIKWMGVYDEQEKVMREITTGKVFTFIPEKDMMLVGSTEFKKIE